jgi:hypothetical protein
MMMFSAAYHQAQAQAMDYGTAASTKCASLCETLGID